MRRKMPPVWLCGLVLLLALLWRMLGAPLNLQEMQGAETALWQARILLPQRVQRIFGLWVGSSFFAAGNAKSETTDEWVKVYLHEKDCVASISLDEYVCGVVAAEMPAAYHLEALKAQTVAARTRVLKQQAENGCTLHPGADICTDSAHCQGYASVEACQAQWGANSTAYRARIARAEIETRGQWLTYDGKPITVLYHAISGGKTEAAKTVFSEALPYLVSVESAGEEHVRGFQEEIYLTFEEMAARLNTTPQEVRQTLTIGAYTESGRVQSVVVAGETWSGTEFRQALGLRSTWFSLAADENGVTFYQRGYGHGVGMSQAGANIMASQGADFEQILQHYYPGTVLQTYLLE